MSTNKRDKPIDIIEHQTKRIISYFVRKNKINKWVSDISSLIFNFIAFFVWDTRDRRCSHSKNDVEFSEDGSRVVVNQTANRMYRVIGNWIIDCDKFETGFIAWTLNLDSFDSNSVIRFGFLDTGVFTDYAIAHSGDMDGFAMLVCFRPTLRLIGQTMNGRINPSECNLYFSKFRTLKSGATLCFKVDFKQKHCVLSVNGMHFEPIFIELHGQLNFVMNGSGKVECTLTDTRIPKSLKINK